MAKNFLLLTVTLGLNLVTNEALNSPLGTCWQLKHRSGGYYCGKPLRSGVSRERCCSRGLKRSWNGFLPREVFYSNTTEEIRAASKDWVRRYRNSVVIDAPSQICLPCAKSCQEVKCGENEKCVMRRGPPKCVCSPECHLKHKAPVCGTDGRTYRSECHLLKRSCRKRKKVKIAHSGKCQSCSGIKCGRSKACILDDLLNAKCIRCPISCDVKISSRKPFCGTDGITYSSKCLAKVASCRSGRMVSRAYRGPCQENASCSSVRCWRHETCLAGVVNSSLTTGVSPGITQSVTEGQPRCWKCGDYHKCPQTPSRICASDGTLYRSWCEFRLEACRSGRAPEAVPLHQCPKKKAVPRMRICSHRKSISEEVNKLMKEEEGRERKLGKKRKRKNKRKERKRRRKIAKEKDCEIQKSTKTE